MDALLIPHGDERDKYEYYFNKSPDEYDYISLTHKIYDNIHFTLSELHIIDIDILKNNPTLFGYIYWPISEDFIPPNNINYIITRTEKQQKMLESVVADHQKVLFLPPNPKQFNLNIKDKSLDEIHINAISLIHYPERPNNPKLQHIKCLNFGYNTHIGPVGSNILKYSKFLIHIKPWGYVCNNVFHAINFLTPVIFDIDTFYTRGFDEYFTPDVDCKVLDTVHEINSYMVDVTDREYLSMVENIKTLKHKLANINLKSICKKL